MKNDLLSRKNLSPGSVLGICTTVTNATHTQFFRQTIGFLAALFAMGANAQSLTQLEGYFGAIYVSASIGTVGYTQDGQSSQNYTGGNGNAIGLSLSSKTATLTATDAPPSGSGLPWQPTGGGVFAASVGGNGGASYSADIAGGVGGTVSASLSDTTISLTQTIGTASAPFNGVTAVSLGGQAGICCVYDQDANGNIDSGTLVLPRWDMTSVAYQGIGFSEANYGSRVSNYGSNGRASNVNLDLDSSSINGSGQYIYGLVAASVGAATPIQTNLPGSGNWKENRDSFFQIADPSDPGWYVDGNANPNNLAISYPGGSGDVSLTLSNKSAITLTGQNLVGVLATSASEPFFIPTNVTNFAYDITQSGAVTVSIDATSSVSVKDANQAGVSFGVLAASTGGSGILPFSSGHVIQGDSVPVPFGVGRSGNVTVTSNGSIFASGETAVGIVALTAANTGGVSKAGGASSNGGSSFGSAAADVAVNNNGTLNVQAKNAIGIYAASTASGGLVHSLPGLTGSGGTASFINGADSTASVRFIQTQSGNGVDIGEVSSRQLGGNGDVSGGTVELNLQAGSRVWVGNGSRESAIAYGAIAQSIGSGGGVTLGGATARIGGGTNSLAGGNGGTVTVYNTGSLVTQGDSAVGILAQSIGGGGGAGANSDSAFVAIGGAGGNGGSGGALSLNFYSGSSVVTNGDYAVGVIGHTIGGGGGHGGAAKSIGLFVDTAIGGSGGGGGNGGNIDFISAGKTFWTAGQHSHGLVLQSIGGGGGVGGSANSHSYGLIFAVSVATGGTGGDGGNGGLIQGGTDGYNTALETSVMTNAHNSSAIILQSIGGGGGVGGAATAKSMVLGLGTFDPELAEVPAIGVAVALGATGGNGGIGGAIEYWHVGNLSTYGNQSHGLHSQTIGGGGGSGGDGTASSQTLGVADTQINVSFGLGGKAAGGADGGDSWLRVGPYGSGDGDNDAISGAIPTTIRTVGHNSVAVFSQSIGGGGGDAGSGSGFNLSAQFTPKSEAPDDETLGQAGSDDVGDLNDFDDLPGAGDATALTNDASSTVGQLDSDVGDMGDFEGLDTSGVEVSGQEKSLFTSAMTCLKKALSSGKISKGLGDCDTEDPSKPSAKTFNLDIAVGRNGAGGGKGGSAHAWLYGNAFTSGTGSHAVFVQSVGGGGGNAAAAGADAHGGEVNATINVGGQGGSGATGGSVTGYNGGIIATGQLYDLANPRSTDVTTFVAPSVIGSEAHGIYAQSIGGGGGHGGNSDPHSSAASSAIIDLINGKYETAALTAMGVSSTDISDLKSGVALLKGGLLGKAPTSFSFSPTINVGGAGGTGGDGGAVSVGNEGSIRTFGHRSFGVFAQSIGGGGGTAGSANGALIDLKGSETLSGIDFNPSINVGGAGGVGGDGGAVAYESTAADSAIVTHGYASYGIALQSVGGGGGVAHEGSTFGLTDTVGLNGDVSVTGGVDFGNGLSSASYSASANSASANGTIAFGGADMNSGKVTGVNTDRTSNDYGTYSYEKVTAGNTGGGGAVNLGTTTATMQGSVITHGDDAMAVFGQSVGGGGGLATLGCSNTDPTNSAHLASACWGNTQVSGTGGQPAEFVGAAGTNGVAITVNDAQTGSESSDTGAGAINVYSSQTITTYGDRSMGLVTQSITGGGGFFSAPNRRIQSVTMPTQQRATNLSPGATTINVTNSTITTYGDGAWGVFAQMVQGGGGFFGDSSQDLAFNVKYSQSEAAAIDVFAGAMGQVGNTTTLKQVVNKAFLATTNTGDSWSNEPMTVSLSNSKITTTGTNAHGMVLQNLGSVGGAWSANETKLNMGISLNGENKNGSTPGGKISLTLNASYIDANGPQSRGVVIQSAGAGPGGNGDQGQIVVNVDNQSRIQSEQHTALMIVGGSFDQSAPNQVNVNAGLVVNSANWDGSIAAVDNTDNGYNHWAVYAPTGYTTLTIGPSGSVRGNVLLGIVTKGDMVNNGGWHGSTAVVANNSLHNYGTIYAGGEGATGGLFIDGSLKHYEGGEIHVDVDPFAGEPTHDVITVTGLARIQGEIVPQTQSLLPGSYTFLTAGTLEYSGSVRDAHVFSWDATVNGNTVAKTPTANFAPAGYGLTGNQTSLAGYLQRSWDASTADHAPLFGYLHEHGLGEHAAYQATLNELMGQTLNAQPIQFQTAFSTYMSESLSCPTVTEQGLRLNQDNCAWAKVTGDISDQSSNSSNPGFRATGGGIRLGAQKSLGNGWSAGFGAGYALNYLTSTNFSSNGQFLDLSVSAKKQIEQWEFGGSLGYAQGWFQNNRYRAMGANGAADAMDGVFASDSRMSIMGLRLRAAYVHELDKDHYLKPYVDVDLSYSSMPGYSETGTAPLALNVGSSSRWNVAITPMLEYGLDVITEDKSRVKLFASAGASFLPNNSHKSETSFAGASAALGTFDVVTDGPEILGRLNLGIQAFHSDDLEVRAQYGLLAGDGYWSQSLSANLVWRF